MNEAIFAGRLVKDPVVKTSTKGNTTTKFCNFSLAVHVGKNKTNFFYITAFKETADIVEKNCHKGDFVTVRCTVINDCFEKNGQKTYTISFILSKITFGSKAKDSNKSDVTIEEDIPMEDVDIFPQ